MEPTCLFFDIECANSFKNIGKICSFGYVLCTQDFTVIESDDILMNPDAPFDWYLFAPGSKCHLSYPKEEYARHPKFPEFYGRIKALMERENCTIIGFGTAGDANFVVSECTRYRLEQLRFSCYDIHPVLEKQYESQGGLQKFTELLQIDTEDLHFHDSRADAYLTMKVTEKLCKDTGKSISQVFKGFTPITSEHIFTDRIRKYYIATVQQKIDALIKRPARPQSGKNQALKGMEFFLLLPRKADIDAVYTICKDITEHGGRIAKKNRPNAVIVKPGKGSAPDQTAKKQQQCMPLHELYRRMGIPAPALPPQKLVPQGFDYLAAFTALLQSS